VFAGLLPVVVLLLFGPDEYGGELAHPAKSIIAANSPSFMDCPLSSTSPVCIKRFEPRLTSFVLTF
jgi:hypothetical protein